MQKQINKPVCFSASRICDLLAQGEGRSRLSYIFDLASKKIGIEKDITTKQMTHGINNELNAAEVFIDVMKSGYINSDGKGSQVFFPINDFVGSTPDIIDDDYVCDIKCPYDIHGFFEQNDKLVKKYYLQVQCQMMSLKVQKGYLMNYLTKPEVFGEDDYQEYPFPLKDRYHIHEIEQDAMVQDDILSYSEKWYPYIGICAEMMQSAKELNHEDFFMMQFKDKVRFQKLKDVNWIENTKQIFRFNDNFYIKKTKDNGVE